MRSLYAEHRSWLHAVPAGAKLLALIAGGSALFLTDRAAPLLAATLACALLLASLGPAAAGARRPLIGVLIAGALIAALHLATGAPQLAWVSVTRLFCGTVLGLTLSLTTRHTDLIDVLERRLAPLRRTGLDVGALSLQLALMLRFTEHFFVQWQQLDEAHRLRTGRPGRLRLLAPLTIQMLEAARRVADTLHIRLGR